MSSYRAQGVLAAGFGLLAGGVLIGCSTPDLKTSLRPEGPPEVLAVLILNENHDEAATYCKPDDEKVPVIVTGGCGFHLGFDCCEGCVGICPEFGSDEPEVNEAVGNADPVAWQVRVVFDELLDTDVETLHDSETDGPCTDTSITCYGSLATTQPVTVTCNGEEIAYDGWYDPTGNNVTLPPGPSLVVFPLDFVPTSSECSIALRSNVVDKDGIQAESGGFGWSLAAFAIASTTPAITDPPPVVAADTVINVVFNSLLDINSVGAGEVVLEDSNGVVAATLSVDGQELLITPTVPLTNDETYTLTLPAGSTFADIGGGELTLDEDVVVTFTVAPAA